MKRIKFTTMKIFAAVLLCDALSVRAQDGEAKMLVAQGTEKYTRF